MDFVTAFTIIMFPVKRIEILSDVNQMHGPTGGKTCLIPSSGRGVGLGSGV